MPGNEKYTQTDKTDSESQTNSESLFPSNDGSMSDPRSNLNSNAGSLDSETRKKCALPDTENNSSRVKLEERVDDQTKLLQQQIKEFEELTARLRSLEAYTVKLRADLVSTHEELKEAKSDVARLTGERDEARIGASRAAEEEQALSDRLTELHALLEGLQVSRRQLEDDAGLAAERIQHSDAVIAQLRQELETFHSAKQVIVNPNPNPNTNPNSNPNPNPSPNPNPNPNPYPNPNPNPNPNFNPDPNPNQAVAIEHAKVLEAVAKQKADLSAVMDEAQVPFFST